MHRTLSSVVLLLAVAGCGTGDGMPNAATGPATAGASPSLGAVVASAAGSAHRIRPLPDGELWVLTFSAEKRADGTVTGYAHVDRKDLEVAWDVEVTCLSVVGNTAWIGGIIRNARGGLPIDGTVSYFYVIDNGEGSSDPLDRASAVRLNDLDGEDLRFCADRPLALVNTDIAHGNVQVR